MHGTRLVVTGRELTEVAYCVEEVKVVVCFVEEVAVAFGLDDVLEARLVRDDVFKEVLEVFLVVVDVFRDVVDVLLVDDVFKDVLEVFLVGDEVFKDVLKTLRVEEDFTLVWVLDTPW